MDIQAILSGYGLAGVIIFVLASVVVFQYRENKDLIRRLFDVQEQRRLEGLETSKELNQALRDFSQSTSLLVDKIQIARGEK